MFTTPKEDPHASGNEKSSNPRVIPKFSSFNPANTVTTVPITTVIDAKEPGRAHREGRHERHRHGDRERGHRSAREKDEKHRDHHRERSSRSERDKERSHRRRRSKSPSSKTLAVGRRSPTPDSWDQSKKSYFSDTRGDKDILTYGTIYRYSIPNYRRRGAGRVLGLQAEIFIDQEGGDGKGLTLRRGGTGGDSSAKVDRYAFDKVGGQSKRRLKIKKEGTGLEDTFAKGMDLVPLSKNKKRKRDLDADDDASRDDYRTLEGPRNTHGTPEDIDLEYATDSGSDGDYVESNDWSDRRRMVEYVRRLDAHPNDIEAWLGYVKYQDTVIVGSGRRKTAAERTSTAEVKLDILSKALDKNPGNETLLLRYMEVAKEIWDSQKLLAEWRRILGENPSVVGLWSSYINFRQTDFMTFTYPECSKCLSECLTVLRSAVWKTAVGSSERQDLENIILYVFLRVVLLMQESGFKETSIASVQAMLELNIFRPAQLRHSTNAVEQELLLGRLEIFWDSEVPRIGEKSARGWASFVDAGEVGDAPEAKRDNLHPAPLIAEGPFGSWTGAEILFSESEQMPARTTDEVEEDDPYRVVLFSDIKAYMFCFSNPGMNEKLIQDFMVFCNLPPLGPRVAEGKNIEEDPFLWNNPSTMKSQELENWFWPEKRSKWDMTAVTWDGMEPEKRPGLGDSPFVFRPQNFNVGTEALFSKSGRWFNGLVGMRMEEPKRAELVREVLKMIVDTTGSESLGLYYLALEWANNPKGVKKVAKWLLKRFKSSLQLWSAYAQIEWYEGGIEAGRMIFSLALGMSEGLTDDSKRDVVHLWHAWIWEEIYAGNVLDALRLLISVENRTLLPKDKSYSPGSIPKSLILKATKYLEDEQYRMLSTGNPRQAGCYNDLRALLDYFSPSRPDLDSALQSYDTFTAAVVSRSNLHALHALTLLRRVHLIYHHSTTTKPYKPATIRQALESALKPFPHNTAFLSLYAWNESRTKIENRIRGMLRQSAATPTTWLFAIWTELRISEHFNVHAVRSLFRDACEREPRALLWRLWIEFEVRTGEVDRAKEVLWTAIKECPWSKDLYMAGLLKLRKQMDNDELKKLVSIMANEKELRVHDVTELEDLEEMGLVRGGGGGGGGRGAGHGLVLPDDGDTDEEMDDD